MDDTVYAPPQSNLHAVPDAVVGDPTFYVVSPGKFILLLIGTLGMYTLYWHYENWSRYKSMAQVTDSEDKDIFPLVRALFSVFFVHALLREVQAHAARKQRPLTWNADANAAVLVLAMIFSSVLQKLWENNMLLPWSAWLWPVSLVVLTLAYCSAQVKINASCGDPEANGNRRLTWANYLWLALGGSLLLLMVAGIVLPEQ